MGAWSYVEPRFRKQLGHIVCLSACMQIVTAETNVLILLPPQLNLVSRKPYGPPAVGVSATHQLEVKSLLTDTFPEVIS